MSLDAKTGLPDPAFGKNGIVDLYQDFDQPPPADGVISSTSPAVVVRNVIVIGAAMVGGTAPRSKENTKGYIRGFDVRTGKRLWTFHTIPQPGEFGNDTWLNDSWSYTGQHDVWSPFSADEELGYVYLPVESATGDFYGGHRPGNNLFAGSLVCLDARTGKRVWHQQLVHHDIWDYDLASPPTLINITVNGKPIRAVAQVTKWGYLFVFDRVNGTPVWPIEERKVEAGTVPGEWYSPTQPHPTKPAPYDRQGVSEAGSDRFHSRAECRSARDAEGIQDRSAVHAADRRAARTACAERCRFPRRKAQRSGRARHGIPKRTCCMSRRSPTCRTTRCSRAATDPT